MRKRHTGRDKEGICPEAAVRNEDRDLSWEGYPQAPFQRPIRRRGTACGYCPVRELSGQETPKGAGLPVRPSPDRHMAGETDRPSGTIRFRYVSQTHESHSIPGQDGQRV